MESFKLITEHRSNLYYKKYKFKVTFAIPHIGRTRYCSDFKAFRNRIELFKSKSWVRSDFRISKQLQTNVQNYFDWKKSLKDDEILVRLDLHKFSICSNDINLLKEYANFFQDVDTVFKTANVNVPQGTMYFKRTPPTKYRVYFKFAKVGNDFYKTLTDLFDRYDNTSSKLYPSKSLKAWLRYSALNKNWIRGNYSIGYNNESDYTILALTIPEALGNNFKLEKSGNE